MAINFSDRILITNPTAFHLGRGILVLALLDLVMGGASFYLGELLLPALAWCVLAVPMAAIGLILMFSGLTKP